MKEFTYFKSVEIAVKVEKAKSWRGYLFCSVLTSRKFKVGLQKVLHKNKSIYRSKNLDQFCYQSIVSQNYIFCYCIRFLRHQKKFWLYESIICIIIFMIFCCILSLQYVNFALIYICQSFIISYYIVVRHIPNVTFIIYGFLK